MKKWIVCGMAVLMMFSMAACGKDKKDDGGTTAPESTGTTQSQTESQPESSTEPAGSTGGTQETDGEETGSSPLQHLKDAVVEVLGENYWPNMEMTAEMLEESLGISPDMYDAFFAEMPMISTHVDTLIIIQAKEGQVEAVEEALNTYRENQINNSVQYPMNVGKVQASRIEVTGNYVIFAQLGADVTAVSESGDEAVIEKCLEDNEKAIDAIEKAIVE